MLNILRMIMKSLYFKNIGLILWRIINSALVFTSFFSIACNDNIPAKLSAVNYSPVEQDSCSANPENNYHILQPQSMSTADKLPLIIILDAHGDGKRAVEKFQPAVEYFPCFVVGSDLIENNFPGYEQAINELIIDVKKKYQVDENKIVIAGFSGGARMAYNFTLHHQLKGLLMCGAGPGKQLPSCPVYAISGMGDFNFSENYIPPSINNLTDAMFTADYFYGNHEWPESSQILDGLVLLLGANDNSFDEIKNKRSKDLVKIADSLENDGNYWMAWASLEKASKLSAEKKTKNEAFENAENLLENKAFLSMVNTLEQNLKTEATLQKAYAERSMTENFDWWKNELKGLNANLEKYKSGMQAGHYLRIKGFIGILLYSRINNMVYSGSNNPQLAVLLKVYQFAEPENPYAYYFQALYDFQSSDNQSCLENLGKSLNLGFTDTGKMKKDFPENILEKIQ